MGTIGRLTPYASLGYRSGEGTVIQENDGFSSYPDFASQIVGGFGGGPDGGHGLPLIEAETVQIDPVPPPPDCTAEDPDSFPESLSVDSTRDDRLVAKAIRAGWPVPEEFRDALIRRQIMIAVNPKSKPRDSTRSFAALVSASKMDAGTVALLQLNQQINNPGRPADSSEPAGEPPVPRAVLYLPDNGRDEP